MKYPVLELWSDSELEWMEVPETLHNDVAEIVARLGGAGPLLLSWRDSGGNRYPFSAPRFLSIARKKRSRLAQTEPLEEP